MPMASSHQRQQQQQHHSRRPSSTSPMPDARDMIPGHVSALSESLRLHPGREPLGGGVENRTGDRTETESISSALTLFESRDAPSSYRSGEYRPSDVPLEQDAVIPWPRGRPRERTRGSHSTGRGGYGNITSAPYNSHNGWAYSEQEQEILRVHAEARRGAIPIGRGGYGNIVHARALANAQVIGPRSHSVDPVAAPTSFSIPVRMFRRREKSRIDAGDERYLSDAEMTDVDEEDQ